MKNKLLKKMKKNLSFIALVLFIFNHTQAQIVSTLAGTGSIGSANSVLPSFTNPAGVCTDAIGNVYVADANCHKIRKITPTGIVSTLAGSGSVGSVDNNNGSLASFNQPYGICINPANGHLIVSDRGNHTIRQVTMAGVVTTLAGTVGVPGLANLTGLSAKFNLPSGVWANAAGEIFVGDYNNGVVRIIEGNLLVNTFANTGGTPTGVTGDAAGNIFVVNRGGNSVLKINTSLVVSTYATGFNDPLNICIDGSGNLYVTNFQGNNIQKITALNTVSTFATVNSPLAIGTNSSGDFFVSQFSNHKISKVTAAGVVSPYSGTGVAGCNDTNNSIATFNSLTAVCVDAAGNVFVADHLNHLIRKITPAGVVSTVAGTAGVAGYLDATGTAALFNKPFGICVDAQNNLYVSEYLNHTVRKITSAGVVSTLAGTVGVFGAVDATGTAASFSFPGGLCMDDAGFVYLADRSNMKIRKINTNIGVDYGVVTTFAGTGTAGSANGTRLASTFNYPSDITFDKASGNFYVSDEYSNQIRKISPAGMVSTVAGSGAVGNTDGAANVATFDRPSGIFVDANCNIFVTQYNGNVVRKVDANGVVSTYAGSSTSGFVNGLGTAARFATAFGIDGDGLGNLYVADLANHAVRKITTAANSCAWKAISTKNGHNLGVKLDGTLWAWGINGNGQLGDGTSTNRNRPVKIGNDTTWISISAGGGHSLALKADGSLWAWGLNLYLQLGDGTSVNKSVPTRIGLANDWKKIEAGEISSYAIKQDSSLWAWGDNGFGRLGDGTGINRSLPVQIGTGSRWIQVSNMGGHTLALKAGGLLWSWGRNDAGQLGNNSTTQSLSPIQIGTASWKMVSAAAEHSIAIKSDGTLWGWGSNVTGACGDGTTATKFIPTLSDASTNWENISTSYGGSVGLKNVGGGSKTLWVWGRQTDGEFGNGVNFSSLLSPVQVGTANNWANCNLSAFYNSHQLLITNTGDLYSTGNNLSGQLGMGNNTSINVLAQLPCISFPQNRCYVNKVATGLNNGMSWANAFVSLDDALYAARSNGVSEIWVAKGTYKPSEFPYNITGNPTLTSRDKTFHLVDGVKMYGGFVGISETNINQRVNILANETILSGDLLGNDTPGLVGQSLANKTDNVYHVVISINDNNCTLLDGFTVKGGQANGGPTYTIEGKTFYPLIGGGADILFSNMKLNKVNFEENYADYAGGIMNSNGSPTIENSAFYLNKCSVGGGGAIITNVGSPIISNTVFSDNTSPNGGPSILNAGYAGIISTIYLTNSTFYNSISTNYTIFGAIDNGNSTGTVVSKNNIFWNGGLGIKDNGLTSIVQNTILSNPLFLGNSGNINADPLFTNPANPKGADGVWRTLDDGLNLQNCSPAINTGDNTAAQDILNDIKEQTRTTCLVDMGAYENSVVACNFVRNNLTPPVVTNVTILSPQVVTLTATGCSGGSIKWYNQAGASVGTGASYTTPTSITTTTRYYADCIIGTCTATSRTQAQISYGPCLTNIVHTTPISPNTYRVTNNITSSVAIPNRTYYQAGQSIILTPGFSVAGGVFFEATIQPCF
jgi:alpha-tubulin suppressor-like RCC1 family protein